MLKRAERYADAVVVPTHAMAAALSDLAPRLAGRIRVIAGAAPAGFRVPTDVAGRLRSLDLPAAFVATSGGAAESDGLGDGFRAVAAAMDGDVVVLDCPQGQESTVLEQAVAAGLPEARVHVRGSLEPHDRAAVIGSASVFLASSRRSEWPWRVVDALATGVPVAAVESAVHREVAGDAAALAPPAALASAVTAATGTDSGRYRVLSRDRAKGFSWREHADRVWQLHAEL